MAEEESTQKMESLILELNKTGLAYLVSNQFGEALDYFKKAERSVTEELKINSKSQKINQIAGITFNNLACYYKKNHKPKVALSYLKRALQLQVYKVEDWVSTASTHINICAIYSHLGKHQESAEHADLALTMLDKVDPKSLKEGQADGQKSYWNIKMLSHYNLAIELQYLKRYSQSREQYLLSKETSDKSTKKNENMKNVIESALSRVDEAETLSKRKIIDLLAKRKVQQEKGNHQFMRRNKKNFGDNQWRSIIGSKKYEIYKTEHDSKRHYQSTQKVKRLAPINDDGRSRRVLEQS